MMASSVMQPKDVFAIKEQHCKSVKAFDSWLNPVLNSNKKSRSFLALIDLVLPLPLHDSPRLAVEFILNL